MGQNIWMHALQCLPRFFLKKVAIVKADHRRLLLQYCTCPATAADTKQKGLCCKSKMTEVNDNLKEELTVCKRSKQHPETAETTRFISPHPHHSHTGVQHDVISYCATKLGLQRNHTSFYFPDSAWCVVSPTPRSVEQLLHIYGVNTASVCDEKRKGKSCSGRCRSELKLMAK